jgi:hypothetical protein
MDIFTVPSVNTQRTQIHWLRSCCQILFACSYLLRRSQTLLPAYTPCRLDGHKVTYGSYMNPFMNVCWKTGYPWHNPICSKPEQSTWFTVSQLSISSNLKHVYIKFGNFRRKYFHIRLNLLMINYNIHNQTGLFLKLNCKGTDIISLPVYLQKSTHPLGHFRPVTGQLYLYFYTWAIQ